MNKVWQFIRSTIFFRLTYMEAEVAWYKEELRKWQDAALISRGLPPLTPREDRPAVKGKSRLTPSQFINKAQNFTQQREKPDGVQ